MTGIEPAHLTASETRIAVTVIAAFRHRDDVIKFGGVALYGPAQRLRRLAPAILTTPAVAFEHPVRINHFTSDTTKAQPPGLHFTREPTGVLYLHAIITTDLHPRMFAESITKPNATNLAHTRGVRCLVSLIVSLPG